MSKLKEWFTANRLAALVTFLGAIAAFIAALQTSFVPGSPAAEALAKAAVAVAAIYKAVTLVEKFLEGSQNWDSLIIAGVPKTPGATVVKNTTAVDMDTGEVTEAEILAHDEAVGNAGAVPASDFERYSGFEGARAIPEPSTTPPLAPGDSDDIGTDAGDPPLRPTE